MRLSLLVHPGLLSQRVPPAPVGRVLVREASGLWWQTVALRDLIRISPSRLVDVVAEDPLVPHNLLRIRKYIIL
jgi:hypothetical protein